MRPEELPDKDKALLDEIARQDGPQIVTMSCYSDVGVMEVRNAACDKLLAARVEVKLKSGKIADVVNRIHLAEPQARDDVPREPHVPKEVVGRARFDLKDLNRRRLERDIEAEEGGPGVYNVDLKSSYFFFFFLYSPLL